MSADVAAPTRGANGRALGSPDPKARAVHRWRTVTRLAPLAPSIVLLALFLLGPVIWSFYGSFTNAALTGPNAQDAQWIGLGNYTKLIADPLFPLSVWLTVVFVLGSAVIGQNFLGLGIALLMEKANRYINSIVGTVVVTAWVLPEIVAAFVAYAYFSKDGTLNQVLAVLGMTGPNWLYSLPMLAIVLANIWRGAAFSMMVYRAALNDVPTEITEAAMIDGAGGIKRLLLITLPMIKRSIATNLMLITLQTLAVFTLIWVMTAGGPSNASLTLPLMAYVQAFRFGDIGYGTAIATVMLIIGGLFSIFYIRVLRPGKD